MTLDSRCYLQRTVGLSKSYSSLMMDLQNASFSVRIKCILVILLHFISLSTYVL